MFDKNGKKNGVVLKEQEPAKKVKHRSRGRSAKNYLTAANLSKKSHKTHSRHSHRAETVKIIKNPSAFEDHLELPELYHSTYVTLVPRDPYCLFAYWEIDSLSIEEISQRVGSQMENARYTLRLYEVSCVDFDGTNANWWHDYDELFMQNRYIHPVSDNASYCAEIGIRLENGEFHSLARSNFCTTPRANMSNRSDLIWQENATNGEGKIFINAKLFDRKTRAALSPRANWQLDTSRIALSREDLKKYYENRQSLNKQLKSLANLVDSDINGLKIVDGDIYIESSLIPGLMKNALFKHSPIGSSDELVKKPEMPFEIEMELTVRGKAQADAFVYLGGKLLKTNPDGSFTLKYELGDDFLPFNFTAVSKEKNAIKKIKTSVLRSKTEYE